MKLPWSTNEAARARQVGDAVQPGDLVVVRTADRKWLKKRALTPCIDGRDFPVIWVCWPDEYTAEHVRPSRQDGLPSIGAPWPCEDVFLTPKPSRARQP